MNSRVPKQHAQGLQGSVPCPLHVAGNFGYLWDFWVWIGMGFCCAFSWVVFLLFVSIQCVLGFILSNYRTILYYIILFVFYWETKREGSVWEGRLEKLEVEKGEKCNQYILCEKKICFLFKNLFYAFYIIYLDPVHFPIHFIYSLFLPPLPVKAKFKGGKRKKIKRKKIKNLFTEVLVWHSKSYHRPLCP